MQASREEVEFRVSEIIEWVRVFISRGDVEQSQRWATRLAHCGNSLLDN